MQMLVSGLGSMIMLTMLALSLIWAASATRQSAPTPYQPEAAAASTAPTAATPPQLAKPRPTVYYQAVTDRPLFAPDRRPQAATEDFAPAPLLPATQLPATPDDAATPAFVLKGVMVIGKLASALIGADDAEPVWAEIGMQVAGWTVSAITPDQIELTLNSNVIRVDLYPK